MDPKAYRQWSPPQRRVGGRAIPGLLVKAEQMGIPGVPKTPPAKGTTATFGQPSFHQKVPTPAAPTPQPSLYKEPTAAKQAPKGPGMGQTKLTVAGHAQPPLPGVAAHQAAVAAPKGQQLALPGGVQMHGAPQPRKDPFPVSPKKPPSLEERWFHGGGGIGGGPKEPQAVAGPGAKDIKPGAPAAGAGGKGDKTAGRMAKLESQLEGIRKQREEGSVMGPNVLGSFGTGVSLGQTATSGLGMAHQLGVLGAAAAGKVHGMMQPQDTDRDRQMRDAYEQRAEQLLIMRRQGGSQAAMGKAVPLVISGVRRFGHG